MNAWSGSTLNTALTVVGSLIVASIVALTAARQWREQLRLQYRLKLFDRAHASISDVTAQAFAALQAQQEWHSSRRRNPVGHSEDMEESRTALHLRWQIARSACDLPPELHRAFDTLRDAYTTFDGEAAGVHWHSGGPGVQPSIAAPWTKFTDAVRAWETNARAWSTDAWKDSEPRSWIEEWSSDRR